MNSLIKDSLGAYASGAKSSADANTRLLLLFSFAVLLVTIFSTMVIYNVTHNLYTSVYYSTSMIFDMEAYDSGSEIAAVVPPFTEEFDLVLAISLFDGIVKAAIVGFVLASLVKFLTTINLSARLNSAVARRLKGHVIVCGYSMLAERLCKDLKAAGLQYLVIDSNPEKAQRLEELGNLVLNRDFTDRSALEAASVKRAAAIIFATEDDFTNLLGVVTAKHMQPNLKIITRAADWANISKMKRGGAKMCLVPEIVAGQELGRKLLGLWST